MRQHPHTLVSCGRKWLRGSRHRKEYLIYLDKTKDTIKSDYGLPMFKFSLEGVFRRAGMHFSQALNY